MESNFSHLAEAFADGEALEVSATPLPTRKSGKTRQTVPRIRQQDKPLSEREEYDRPSTLAEQSAAFVAPGMKASSVLTQVLSQFCVSNLVFGFGYLLHHVSTIPFAVQNAVNTLLSPSIVSLILLCAFLALARRSLPSWTIAFRSILSDLFLLGKSITLSALKTPKLLAWACGYALMSYVLG